MGAPGRRIVVVDDDPSVLRTVQRQLDSLGWEAYPVGTAREALAVLQSLGPVEALLTDVNMPVMDGPSLGREVAARFPGTTVLLMSGGDASALQRADHAPSIVLCKPFTVQALAAALNAACGDTE